jgi:hypothetical protein
VSTFGSKSIIYFGTNSGERAATANYLAVFSFEPLLEAQDFRGGQMLLADKSRQKQQKQPMEAEGDSLRGGNPAMLPAPPGGSTNRATRRSPN